MDSLVREFESIDSHMSDIKGALKHIAKTLEDGTWIRYPDLLVTTRDIAGEGIASIQAVAAKLQEFKLVWESSPRGTSGRAHGLIWGSAREVQAQGKQVGQQLLALLADPSIAMNDEVRSDVAAISSKALQLGKMRLYSEIEEFNVLGNQIVTAVDTLLTKLLGEEADADLAPTSPEFIDAASHISEVQATGNVTANSSSTSSRKNVHRRKPQRGGR